jgi:fructose-1,6-bisphosphatase/inositol monophosphatase family enzyme
VKPWDWAAGGLIARRAGLVLRELAATDAEPFGVCVAAPVVMDELIGLIVGG